MLPVAKLFSVVTITLLHSLTGVAQTKRSSQQLLYNGKNYNQLITGRVPEYGIAGRDGCVVMREIILELHDVDAQIVEGLVKDAETSDSLPGARIKLEMRDGRTETLTADVNGRFLLNKSAPIKDFHVQYIGYRILNVKAVSRKLF